MKYTKAELEAIIEKTITTEFPSATVEVVKQSPPRKGLAVLCLLQVEFNGIISDLPIEEGLNWNLKEIAENLKRGREK